jgi:hypothetical protein
MSQATPEIAASSQYTASALDDASKEVAANNVNERNNLSAPL